MNKFVLPLIGTALLLIGLAMFISCDQTPTSDRFDRFEKLGEYEAQGEGCSIRIIRDRKTSCQYIIACNSIASMPHTCFLDGNLEK